LKNEQGITFIQYGMALLCPGVLIFCSVTQAYYNLGAFWRNPGCGNIALVQAVPGTAGSQNITNDYSESQTINETAGHLLVAIVYAGENPGGSNDSSAPNMRFSVSDTLGNTYYAGPLINNGLYNVAAVQIFYAYNIAGGSNTVTAISNSPQIADPWTGLFLQEYSGIATTSVVDVSSGQAAPSSTATVTPGTMTTSTSCDLVVAAFADGHVSSQTDTGGAGWTTRSSDSFDPAWVFDDSPIGVVAGQTVNAVMNLTGGADNGWAAAQTAFRGAKTSAPAQPTQLAFTTSSQSVTTRSCSSAVTIQSQNASAQPTNTSTGINIALSGSGLMFYADANCVYPISSVYIGAGTNTQSFYFQGTAAGSPTITASIAPTLVHENASGYVTASSLTATWTETAGDFLVAAVYWNQNSATVTVSDPSNTWNSTPKLSNTTACSSGQGSQVQLWYAQNIAGGSNTVTISQSTGTNPLGAYVFEYSGIPTSGALDTSTGKVAPGWISSLDTGNLTTTGSEDLIVSLFNDTSFGNATIAPGLGWISEDTNTNFITMIEDNVSAAGTYDPSATLPQASNCWAATAAAFKSANAQAITQTETISGTAPYTWIGGAGCSGNWPTGVGILGADHACWQGGVLPGSSNIAHFDATCTINCSPTITGTINVGGIWMHSNYAGTITQGANSLTINGGFEEDAGTFTGGSGAMTVNGSFTLTGGTFTAPTSSGSLTFAGAAMPDNFIVSGSPTFNANGGSISFGNAGSGSGMTISPGSAVLNNVTFAVGQFTTVTINGTLNMTGNLSVNMTNSTLDGGVISLAGNVACTADAGGTVSLTFVGGNAQTFTASGTPITGSYVVNKTAGSTLTLSSSLTLSANGQGLSIASGILNIGAFNITVGTLGISNYDTLTMTSGTITNKGYWLNNGTFNAGTGTVTFTGGAAMPIKGTSSTTFNNLIINRAGATFTLGKAITVSGNLTITAGTLNAAGFGITLGGNWSKSGTFTAASNTVTLTGNASHTITGANTFYNLSMTTSGPETLTFQHAVTQTITNSLTLSASSGNVLSLVSDSPGTAWGIHPPAATYDYLSIQDSDNTSGNTLHAGSNSTNVSGNTNWTFP
jgi:hypothetical protein